MAYAKLHGRIVLTHDLDFSAILAATKGDKPSVVQVRAGNVRTLVKLTASISG
jgi:predicted nuclease of predicted toxin-antitoxin system